MYSTNIVTEYFKHGIHSPFFSLQSAVCFIILTYLVPVLFKFYIQGVLKFKKIIPAPKVLSLYDVRKRIEHFSIENINIQSTNLPSFSYGPILLK